MAERGKTDWEAIERDYRSGRGHFPKGEAGAVRLIRSLLTIDGGLEAAFDIPPILRVEQEFPLPRGRADFVLFHADGSATIVEVKDAGSDRDILGGIGQLMSYAVQLGFSRTLTSIRRVLAAPMDGTEAHHLSEACELAGVAFVPLGRMWQHECIWAEEGARHAARHN